MSIKSIEQVIAKFCLIKIQDYAKKSNPSKLKSDLRRLPAMITNNGLLATLAFYKKNNEDVYDIINQWFSEEKKETSGDLVEYLINESVSYQELLFKTSEVLKLADWLKRIAEVEINDEETKKEEQHK